MMKLWLLVDKTDDGPGYDCTAGFVIRAKTELAARLIATKDGYGDEKRRHPDFWENEEYSSCEQLTESGKPGVILRDFNAG